MRFANQENQKAIEENKCCEAKVENVKEIAMKVEEESKEFEITEEEKFNLKENIKYITSELTMESEGGRTDGLWLEQTDNQTR